MASISLPDLIILIIAQLILLGGAVLFIHRLSTRFGLSPLLILLDAHRCASICLWALPPSGLQGRNSPSAWLVLAAANHGFGSAGHLHVNGTRRRIALGAIILIAMAFDLLTLLPIFEVP
jgi:hypothetical protein